MGSSFVAADVGEQDGLPLPVAARSPVSLTLSSAMRSLARLVRCVR